jgi:hypothetical protein
MDYTAWDTTKEFVDLMAFDAAKPILNVLAGLYNDDPGQIAVGYGQQLAMAVPGGVISGMTRSLGPAGSGIIVNLGGEGEVVGSNVVNIQPTMDAALHAATKTDQQVIIASGDALPFRTGSVPTVVTNSVPVGTGSTWLGARYLPAEITRILTPSGTWSGSSALPRVLTGMRTRPW